MSKELLKNTKFLDEVKSFFEKNKSTILDIVLFGSSVKGKDNPKDVDILVVYKDKKDAEAIYIFRKKLEKDGFNADITDKTYKELFEESFIAREAYISEGYSLIYKRFISEGLGYLNYWMFRYELTGFNKSDRMRFYYSIYGRNNQKGMIDQLEAIKFSDSILICHVKNSEKMREYLDSWKIKYIDFPILIPARMKNVLKK